MAELPEQRVRDRGKHTLVLDLDGTLIGIARYDNKENEYDFIIKEDEEHAATWIRKRPGLDEFLKEMSQVYEIVVFSQGRDAYVDMVKSELDPDGSAIAYWLSRKSCSGSNNDTHKDLNSPNLGRDLSTVVWLDDFKNSFKKNRENGLVVPMFKPGTKNDRVLLDLIPHLKSLAASAQDVRTALASLPFPSMDDKAVFASTVSRPI